MRKNLAFNADNVLMHFVEPVKLPDVSLKTLKLYMHLEKATHE